MSLDASRVMSFGSSALLRFFAAIACTLMTVLPAQAAFAQKNPPTTTAALPPATSPSSSSAVALGVYRPSLPDDLAGLAQDEKAMRQPYSIVQWYALWGGWKSAFSRADLDAVSAHGSLPLITWEPWAGTGADPAWSLQTAILSGRNDAYIASWATGLAAYGKPVLLRFAHEMHNQASYPWAVGVNGNTAADYVAAWKYVRAIFRQNGANNVEWVWNPNTLGDAPSTAYTAIYSALYPGDDQVDYLGLDIYNTGPQLDWGAPRWRTFGQALANPYTAITAVSNKPLLLPEVASTEVGGSKAAWIQDALSTGLDQFPRVRALVWFDVAKEQPWNLNSSSASLSAWHTASAAARFRVGPTIPTL
jgi:hypothetical protein